MKLLVSADIDPCDGGEILSYVFLEVTLRDEEVGVITAIESCIKENNPDEFFSRFDRAFLDFVSGKIMIRPPFNNPYPNALIRGIAILSK